MNLAYATLGGGCFWCLEAVFNQLHGVLGVRSGYMGGQLPEPSYRAICAGNSGHAEVVQIEFDPKQISYTSLLEVFFAIHDPSTLNRQGNDVGSQYRSVIFYHDISQHDAAQFMIAALDQAAAFAAPVVTEICPAAQFWPAEAEHQDYYARNPNQGYCAVVIAPKLRKLMQQFADRVK